MAQPEYTAMSPAEKSLSLRQGSGGSSYPMQLQTHWREFTRELEQCPVDSGEFKNQLLPLARIKKIMKQDEDVRMIAAEAPILFAKACEFFVLELTQRSWNVAEEQKRRTIQINDLSTAIARTEIFDFLMDVVPDPDKAAWSDSGGGCADPNGSCSPAAPPPGPTHTPPSPPLAGSRSPLAFSNSHAALHKAAAGAPAVPGYALPLGVSGGQHSYLGQDPGTGNGRTSGSLHVGLAPAMQTGMHALAHAAPQDYVGRGGGW